MTPQIVNCNCPDCKNPLDYYLQAPLHPKSTRPSYWIGTCRTVGCTLNSVTLDDKGWGELVANSEMLKKYRQSVIDNSASTAELIARYGGAK